MCPHQSQNAVVENGAFSSRLVNLLLPLVFHSCLKKPDVLFGRASIILIPFPQTALPSDLLYSSSWLGLWSVVWKAQTPWWSAGREPHCDRTGCLANTHRSRCPPGSSCVDPQMWRTEETDPPTTTALCIQTHPRKKSLPVMATCHTHTHTLTMLQHTNTLLSVNKDVKLF